jgi:hypothetical protein
MYTACGAFSRALADIALPGSRYPRLSQSFNKTRINSARYREFI